MFINFVDALVAQLEERQPPELNVAGSNPAERASYAGRTRVLPALLFSAIVCAAPAWAAPAVEWPLPAVAVTSTESGKWSVRIVPDGAGGAVIAWEENRGKRMCCRDTRDLYVQRLDSSGRKLWGDTDYQLAADAAGEELEGMAPAAGGGALVLWRRGLGTLVAEELDGDRRPRGGAEPAIVSATADVCEWQPTSGFAASPDGKEALLVWGQPAAGGTTAIRTVLYTRTSGAWDAHGVSDAPVEAGVHPGAVAWCGPGRWLLLVWCEGDPVRLDGVWLGEDGRPKGRRFRVASADAGGWLHVEAAANGTGGAWATWECVVPGRMEKLHKVRVAAIEPAPDGGGLLRSAEAGDARTLAMFIPSTMVAVGNQQSEPATPATVAWRSSIAIAPAGTGAAVIARSDGERMWAAAVRGAAGGLAIGRATALGGTVFTGCPPVAAPLSGGRVALVWAVIGRGGWRLRLDRLVIAGERVRTEGEPVEIDGTPGLSPRVSAVSLLGPGSLGIAWAGIFNQDHGGVVAQKVPIR